MQCCNAKFVDSGLYCCFDDFIKELYTIDKHQYVFANQLASIPRISRTGISSDIFGFESYISARQSLTLDFV